MSRDAILDIAMVCALLIVAIVVAGPAGDFPLNDDWSFGLTVRELVDNGRYLPNAWTAMTLLTHTLWGALFCLPFGFSVNALRVSTIVAALLGSAFVYLGLRRAGRSRGRARLAAGVTTINPISFPLSLTFMTETFFVTLTAAATWLLVGHLRDGRDRLLVGGTVLAVLAILCRQIGIVLPAAFAVAMLATGRRRLPDVLRALVPLAAGLAALRALESITAATGVMPVIYAEQPSLLRALFVSPGIVPKRDLGHAQMIAMFMGLFLLPLLACTPASTRKLFRRLRISRWFMFVSVALVIGFPLHHFGMMPVGRGNVMMSEGVGPLTLRDTNLLHLGNYAPLSPWIWIVITIAGVLGAALLGERVCAIVGALWARRREFARDPELPILLFCLSMVAIQSFPLVVLGFFDRYLVPLLVPLVYLVTSPLIVRESSRGRRAAAGGLLAVMAAFSVTVTHDYMAWNRARWRLTNEWTRDRGLTAAQIDGGFEFNGLHRDHRRLIPVVDGKSWWWVQDDLYLVSFGPVPGYQQVDFEEYRRWLPPGRGRILVSRRLPPP